MNDATVPSDIRKEKLEKWLTEYGDAVLRMCYLYLGDHALSQDALQDTFIKVWRGMDAWRAASSEKTWIMRIAINTCKDYRRSAWMRHVDRGKSIDDLPLAFRDETAESKELFEHIKRLPPKFKQVILLYHFQDMTMADTGKALGIGRSTVQNRLKKAYALLRYEYEGSDFGETT